MGGATLLLSRATSLPGAPFCSCAVGALAVAAAAQLGGCSQGHLPVVVLQAPGFEPRHALFSRKTHRCV